MLLTRLTALLRSQVTAALSTTELRRLHGSYGISQLALWLQWVSLATYGLAHGGAAGTGLMAVARTLPIALLGAFGGALADRLGHRRALVIGLCVEAIATALSAVAMATGQSRYVVMLCVVGYACAATVARPARSAVAVELPRTPQQLAASASFSTFVLFAGCAVGAVVGSVFAHVGTSAESGIAAACYGVSAIVAATLLRSRRSESVGAPLPDEFGEGMQTSVAKGLADVMRVLDLRLLLTFLWCAALMEGVLDVALPVVSYRNGWGGSGIGWLNAAWGVGGLLGATAALVVLRQSRYTATVVLSALVLGASVLTIGIAPAAVVVAIVVYGVAEALGDGAATALVQRLGETPLLGTAFALFETGAALASAVGSAALPLLLHIFGLHVTLIVAALLLPVVGVLIRRRLASEERHVEVPEGVFERLRASTLFAPLPIASLERLAVRAQSREVAQGDVIVRRGDPGDELFVVSRGTLLVSETPTPVPPLTVGDHFGEIAVLARTVRTATISAETDAEVLAVGRADFLASATGRVEAVATAYASARGRNTY